MKTMNCLTIKYVVGAKENTAGAFYSPLALRAPSTELAVAVGINFSYQ